MIREFKIWISKVKNELVFKTAYNKYEEDRNKLQENEYKLSKLNDTLVLTRTRVEKETNEMHDMFEKITIWVLKNDDVVIVLGISIE